MTAADVKAALRARHPALGAFGEPGPWTVLEEWMNVDVLAFSAWSSPPTARVGPVRHPIVGYEVKVSRSDYRRELSKPGKRAAAVAFTNAFYMAVPDGLLRPDEVAWVEEPWVLEPGSWRRVPCRYSDDGAEAPHYRDDPGPCIRGKRSKHVEGPLLEHSWGRNVEPVRCDACNGRGYSERSRVELEAPKLWVPADVGLITVDENGQCKVRRKAPIRVAAPRIPVEMAGELLDRARLTELVRWVSYRPDPRHAGRVTARAAA